GKIARGNHAEPANLFQHLLLFVTECQVNRFQRQALPPWTTIKRAIHIVRPGLGQRAVSRFPWAIRFERTLPPGQRDSRASIFRCPFRQPLPALFDWVQFKRRLRLWLATTRQVVRKIETHHCSSRCSSSLPNSRVVCRSVFSRISFGEGPSGAVFEASGAADAAASLFFSS